MFADAQYGQKSKLQTSNKNRIYKKLKKIFMSIFLFLIIQEKIISEFEIARVDS
jgi:hypothetical protein